MSFKPNDLCLETGIYVCSNCDGDKFIKKETRFPFCNCSNNSRWNLFEAIVTQETPEDITNYKSTFELTKTNEPNIQENANRNFISRTMILSYLAFIVVYITMICICVFLEKDGDFIKIISAYFDKALIAFGGIVGSVITYYFTRIT